MVSVTASLDITEMIVLKLVAHQERSMILLVGSASLFVPVDTTKIPSTVLAINAQTVVSNVTESRPFVQGAFLLQTILNTTIVEIVFLLVPMAPTQWGSTVSPVTQHLHFAAIAASMPPTAPPVPISGSYHSPATALVWSTAHSQARILFLMWSTRSVWPPAPVIWSSGMSATITTPAIIVQIEPLNSFPIPRAFPHVLICTTPIMSAGSVRPATPVVSPVSAGPHRVAFPVRLRPL